MRTKTHALLIIDLDQDVVLWHRQYPSSEFARIVDLPHFHQPLVSQCENLLESDRTTDRVEIVAIETTTPRTLPSEGDPFLDNWEGVLSTVSRSLTNILHLSKTSTDLTEASRIAFLQSQGS